MREALILGDAAQSSAQAPFTPRNPALHPRRPADPASAAIPRKFSTEQGFPSDIHPVHTSGDEPRGLPSRTATRTAKSSHQSFCAPPSPQSRTYFTLHAVVPIDRRSESIPRGGALKLNLLSLTRREVIADRQVRPLNYRKVSGLGLYPDANHRSVECAKSKPPGTWRVGRHAVATDEVCFLRL